MGGYLFDHAWESELPRLRLLEDIFDPGTFRHLEALGVGPGWRCLEVGAGAGSVVRWLCDRVGPGGRVVATDTQTGFLERLEEPNLEVRRHDIVADDLEGMVFDLVHARIVLEHLAGRDLALKRMAAALAPGGVLLVEDFDWSALVPAPGAGADLFERFVDALLEVMQAVGYTHQYGRRLPLEFRALGLTEVGAEGLVAISLSGTPAAEWWRLNIERLREPLVTRGGLTDAEVEALLRLTDDEGFCFQYPVLVTAWGRRPPA